MASSFTTKSTAIRNKFLFRIILLFVTIAVVSCSKRQIETATTQLDAPPQFWIRVLLVDNAKTATLTISTSFTITNPSPQLPQAAFPQPNAPITATVTDGKISIAGWHFDANEITILPDTPHTFSLNGNEYRGKLKFVLHPDKNSFDAINLIPLEPYLAGVVGAEMPSYWEPQALKAQTIAARTYCLYIKKRFGKNRHWDLKKTQAHQAYHGTKTESAQIWDVVKKTWGKVLICKQPDGTTDIFPTYYSSSCGGHTENSRNVFGGNFLEPLAGVPCPHCKYITKPNFFDWPPVEIKKTELTARLLKRYRTLKPLGEITSVIVARQTDYGEISRLTRIKLIGSTGKTDSLRAEDLRLAIDPTGLKIKSTIFRIVDSNDKWIFKAGRGFGHGVGMCQCGAEQLARQGNSAEYILSYYYPKSDIKNIYDD